MKPDSLSRFALYSSEDLCKKLFAEGYTEMSIGGGPWVKDGEFRMVGVSAFFHPDGRIHTLQTHKRDMGQGNMRGQREEDFTEETFGAFLAEWRVTMGPKRSLQEMLLAIA